MDANDPRKEGSTLSYSQIAAELNRRWPEFNQGKRTRGTVIDYYNRKREAEKMRVVLLSLPPTVKMSKPEIERLVISHCVPIGTK